MSDEGRSGTASSRPRSQVRCIFFKPITGRWAGSQRTAPRLPRPAQLELVLHATSISTKNWLNSGPTDLPKWGLPDGLLSRVVTRRYVPALTVHFAGRLDQIHFKLYAMVDQAGGRHEADLRALDPSPEELIAAARWTVTQDPSPGYRMVLKEALSSLGNRRC